MTIETGKDSDELNDLLQYLYFTICFLVMGCDIETVIHSRLPMDNRGIGSE